MFNEEATGQTQAHLKWVKGPVRIQPSLVLFHYFEDNGFPPPSRDSDTHWNRVAPRLVSGS